jgi:hypothetical protein
MPSENGVVESELERKKTPAQNLFAGNVYICDRRVSEACDREKLRVWPHAASVNNQLFDRRMTVYRHLST